MFNEDWPSSATRRDCPISTNAGTAMSFITNTNWQSHGGESTLSNFSQMGVITFPMFRARLRRGDGVDSRLSNGGTGPGNFYRGSDPFYNAHSAASLFCDAFVMIAQGAVQILDAGVTGNTLPGSRRLERPVQASADYCNLPSARASTGDKICNLECTFQRWWAGQDSNLQPDRYERPALTVELPAPTGLD
jgi:hypothetical protein